MSRRKLDGEGDFVTAEQEYDVPVGTKKKQKEQYAFEEDGEKYRPYAISKTKRIPTWLKVVFTKWWVPGMIFYFVYFGFGYTELLSGYILALVFALAWGIITDVFVNHAFRGFDAPGYDYKKYVVFGRERKLWTLPLNLLLGVVFNYVAVIEIIIPVYGLIAAYSGEQAANDFMFFGGAFAYATLILALDMASVGIKLLILGLFGKKQPEEEE